MKASQTRMSSWALQEEFTLRRKELTLGKGSLTPRKSPPAPACPLGGCHRRREQSVHYPQGRHRSPQAPAPAQGEESGRAVARLDINDRKGVKGTGGMRVLLEATPEWGDGDQ